MYVGGEMSHVQTSILELEKDQGNWTRWFKIEIVVHSTDTLNFVLEMTHIGANVRRLDANAEELHGVVIVGLEAHKPYAEEGRNRTLRLSDVGVIRTEWETWARYAKKIRLEEWIGPFFCVPAYLVLFDKSLITFRKVENSSKYRKFLNFYEFLYFRISCKMLQVAYSLQCSTNFQ